MIGNDIIDLALARKESNWQRKGFLDKIFTHKEQLLILNAKNAEVMVWNLWSRKEAAYKIYNRQTGIRGYFPLQLECSDLNISNQIIFGKVIIKERVYFTKTEIKKSYIHTISVENIADFNRVQQLKNRDNIIKYKGIPSFSNKKNLMLSPISISHHGRFKQIICF